MRKIDECVGLTVAEINQEIEERRKAAQEMVGWLYPSMMRSEIAKLLDLRDAAEIDKERAAHLENPEMPVT